MLHISKFFLHQRKIKLKLYIKGWRAGIQTSTENLEIDLSLVLLHNFPCLFLVNPTKEPLF